MSLNLDTSIDDGYVDPATCIYVTPGTDSTIADINDVLRATFGGRTAARVVSETYWPISNTKRYELNGTYRRTLVDRWRNRGFVIRRNNKRIYIL